MKICPVCNQELRTGFRDDGGCWHKLSNSELEAALETIRKARSLLNSWNLGESPADTKDCIDALDQLLCEGDLTDADEERLLREFEK